MAIKFLYKHYIERLMAAVPNVSGRHFRHVTSAVQAKWERLDIIQLWRSSPCAGKAFCSWARAGEFGLEALSPVFSFVYGSKRTALQLLCCRAILAIRNDFAQAMHGSILSSSCFISIFWLRMSMSFWRSRK